MNQSDPNARTNAERPANGPQPGVREAGQGVRWRLVGNSAEKVLNLAALPILMRLVDRGGWGLVYYAMIVYTLVAMLRDLGIPQAIIRSPSVSQRFLSSCFWIRLAVGVALYAVLVAVAYPISLLFGGEKLLLILLVMGLALILDAMPSIQLALLIRDLQVKQATQIRIVSVVFGVVLSVVLALFQFHAWALVAGSITTTILSCVLCWFATPWRPTFAFDRDEFFPLVRFGVNVTGTQTLSWFTEYFGGFILGIAGAGEIMLGYFSRAYIFAKYPDSLLGSVVGGGLATSLFAKMQHDEERMRDALHRATRVMYLVGLPLSVVLIVLTGDFFSVVAGPRWTQAELPCRIIAIGGTCLMLRQTLRHWLVAANQTSILLRNQVVVAAVSIGATLLAVAAVAAAAERFDLPEDVAERYSMIGVAIATTIACAVEFVLLWVVSRNITRTTLMDWIANYWRPIACALAMALALAVTRWFLPQLANLTLRVLTEAFVGTTVWLTAAWLLCADDLMLVARLATPSRFQPREAEDS